MNNSQQKVEKNKETKIDIVLENKQINKENESLNQQENKEEIVHEDFKELLDIPLCTLGSTGSTSSIETNIDELLPNYVSKDTYLNNNNNIDEQKDSSIKTNNKIKHKKDSNGNLDLEFLDIPAFLRRQAD